MSQGAAQERITGVQGLRFLAAFAVLIGHVEIFAYHLGRFRGVELGRPPLIGSTAFGVDLFFAISGFIMIVSSQHLFASPGARRRFMARRLRRIVPLYWLALGFTVTWGWRFGPAADLRSTASAFAFIPHPSPVAHGRIVPPLKVGWTLNYEMLFYVLFALCLGTSARATALRLFALLAAGVVLGAVLPLPQPLAYWTDPIVLEFAGGTGIALLYRKGVALPAPVRLGMVLLAALLVLLPSSAATGTGGQGGWLRLLTWGAAGWLVLAATVLGPLRLRPPGAWRIGGDLSYALYLVHMPLLMVAQFLWRHYRLPYGPAEALLFAIGMTALYLAVAAAVHFLLEKPLLSRRD
ncbi:MAG: acyltransferase family protein [Novosphingobium sp.]